MDKYAFITSPEVAFPKPSKTNWANLAVNFTLAASLVSLAALHWYPQIQAVLS
jgi:hypothetical protein